MRIVRNLPPFAKVRTAKRGQRLGDRGAATRSKSSRCMTRAPPAGLSQLGRRFKGNDLEAHYEDGEIIEVIHTSSAAVFMVTNLVTKHFKFVDEGKKVDELFLEWGKHH